MAEKPLNKELYGNLTAKALRSMSEQLGDSEFETEIAPYNNYTGGTPVANADYEGLKPGVGKMALFGQYTPADFTPEQVEANAQPWYDRVTGKSGVLEAKRDIVQGVTAGATPNTWQHEFNHRNNPNRSESGNRRVDGIIAPDKRAWERAVDMKVDLYRRQGSKASRETVERNMLSDIQGQHQNYGPRFTAEDVYNEEIGRGGRVPEAMQTPNWFMEYSEQDHLNDYAKMRKNQAYWPHALREMQAKDKADNNK